MGRCWSQWNWQRDPDAPLHWPNPEQRIVLCEPFTQEAWTPQQLMENGLDLTLAVEQARDRGAAFVCPYDLPYLRRRDSADIPALLVRRQDDLYGVHMLNRMQSEHKALLIEPEEAINLDPPVCPDCGRLDVVTGTDGATPFCAECDGMSGEGTEMCYGSILDPLNEGVDLVIVRGQEKPVHPQWVRATRDQCQEAGVRFVLLGWGAWMPESQLTGLVQRDVERLCKGDELFYHVGHERSGRMLDGHEWLEVPEGI